MPVTEEQATAAAIGLLKLHSKASYKADADLDAGYREVLKEFCKQAGEGWSHEDARGKVKVSKPTERRLKGIEYTLDLEAFLERDSEERAKLMKGDGNKPPLVREDRVYTEARAPSITVDIPD